MSPRTRRREAPAAAEGRGAVVLMHPRMAEAAGRALSGRERHVHALATRGWEARRIAVALGLPASAVRREAARAARAVAAALDAA